MNAREASRANGAKGGRPRKWFREIIRVVSPETAVFRSANAVKQRAYRERHGLHGDGGSRRPGGMLRNPRLPGVTDRDD